MTGTFGTAPKIRVRGATSIYGSSKPLWVVDGVIQEDVVEAMSSFLVKKTILAESSMWEKRRSKAVPAFSDSPTTVM